jgi:hypothetical protein
MQGAGTVAAGFSIPTVTVTRNPTVNNVRHPMHSGNKQNPGHQIPARKLQSDLGPGVYPGVDATLPIDGLHRTHGLLTINVRKSLNGVRIV